MKNNSPGIYEKKEFRSKYRIGETVKLKAYDVPLTIEKVTFSPKEGTVYLGRHDNWRLDFTNDEVENIYQEESEDGHTN